jgi:hypothetical protein
MLPRYSSVDLYLPSDRCRANQVALIAACLMVPVSLRGVQLSAENGLKFSR